MRLGIYERAFPYHLDLESCLTLVRQAGFDGVELTLHDVDPLLPEARNEVTDAILKRNTGLDRLHEGGLCLHSTSDEINGIRTLASNVGLAITSLSSVQLAYYQLSSAIPEVQSRAIQTVQRMIETTALLGGDVALVYPGLVTQGARYEEVWQRSHDAIAALVPFAEERGVAIAIENVWNRFLYSPLEYRDYIDSFHSPFVGAYFDIANALRYGLPEQWIELLGERIKRVHFKDYRLDMDDFRGFTYLLQGDVPWQRVLEALDQIGYNGWAIVEVPPYRSHPEQTLIDSAAAMRKLLGIRLERG